MSVKFYEDPEKGRSGEASQWSWGWRDMWLGVFIKLSGKKRKAGIKALRLSTYVCVRVVVVAVAVWEELPGLAH
jgi:hypothetical protein